MTQYDSTAAKLQHKFDHPPECNCCEHFTASVWSVLEKYVAILARSVCLQQNPRRNHWDEDNEMISYEMMRCSVSPSSPSANLGASWCSSASQRSLIRPDAPNLRRPSPTSPRESPRLLSRLTKCPLSDRKSK